MYSEDLVEAIKKADEELKEGKIHTFEEVFGYPQKKEDDKETTLKEE